MDSSELKNIVEAAMLAAGGPLTLDQLRALFGDNNAPDKHDIRTVIKELQADYEGRGIELREVASGFRIQVREGMSKWLGKLWEERPPRYSRALMETLAIVAYRQPVTRGDIEEIRGVSVTTNIIRTLLERDWIKVVGHRDVPGKPAIFGTTRDFLDYFSLKKLEDLPPLAELASLEPVEIQLQLGTADQVAESSGEEGQADVETTAADDTQLSDDVETSDSIDEIESGEQGDTDAFAAFEDDEEDLELSEEEIAAASARIDAITAELSGKNDDQESEIDVAPGAVQPLVGLNAPGSEPQEPATVSSLDDARVAAEQNQVANDPVDDSPAAQDSSAESLEPPTAEVVPLKNP
jgi:segregation and condensation protein B